MQLQSEAAFNDAIIKDREQGIKDIENAVHDVHEIFVDLSNLVSEQGSMIGKFFYFSFTLDNIEDHVDKTKHNVGEGVIEIRKASDYQRKSRTKLCCLLLILVIICAAVVAVVFLFLK
jgi:t-SNARE complex subunit (syntaxin)